MISEIVIINLVRNRFFYLEKNNEVHTLLLDRYWFNCFRKKELLFQY